MSIILASSSPRRREILEMFGIDFVIMAPDIDEDIIRSKYDLADKKEREDCLKALALAKARAIQEKIGDDQTILAADTMVFADKPLGKPKDNEDALNMLKSLAGKSHEVITAFAIINKSAIINESVRSTVRFIPMDENYLAFAQAYVRDGYSTGKAGAYGIQDRGAYFVDTIDGDYYNIMGLPIESIRHIICG